MRVLVIAGLCLSFLSGEAQAMTEYLRADNRVRTWRSSKHFGPNRNLGLKIVYRGKPLRVRSVSKDGRRVTYGQGGVEVRARQSKTKGPLQLRYVAFKGTPRLKVHYWKAK